ncbi:DUF58 domain-containing protein [Natronobacterium gregoryi]|uniref:DUF58 domain-containing protein n=2 Tax=Natronobacterium gregoryi TaxID=44930 RepID=L0AJ92_NATGS|nr:DUF58 domain-containing protein [Natronobacterium gregoryi]AFZ73237.1 hypothetical protein Natgr_2054 [Natronobacterium gregoryi SP2]ELY71304.1 hypothetical protein C490_05217 [Natronobacterium gregoryi SP2]PLK21646.1 DUF58 domain-containing protein [Natronobacterium gregoryi SP2]SFI57754.1 Uncharacterized conserved protein, DUF58 family, contains vWF domain [Natronobacterium gregoryi]
MRLTLRGWTALAVVGFSVAMSWQYGPRALNAVVTPLVVVLVAGAVMVIRSDRPTVRRRPVTDGPIGDRRTVTVDVESDRSTSATVRDAVGDGLSVTDAVDDGLATSTTLEAGTNAITYELRLEERGAHDVGPVSVAVRDAFGLLERRFAYEETTPIHVYPRPRDLRGSGDSHLQSLVESTGGHGTGVDLDHDRAEFDRLREYRRGDSLRDVHWKSAAKRPDGELFVAEYATDAGHETVVVAAECSPGYEDDLATAVASLATFFLESGLQVGLRTDADSLQPEAGRAHHRNLLRTIAVLESGSISDGDRDEADVLVTADERGTRVASGDWELPFERLVGDRYERTFDPRRGRSNADDNTEAVL